jgi:ankyrin repeat protein
MLDKDSIFQLVRLNNHTELSKIINQADSEIINEDGQSLLHEAAAHNSYECASLLISKKFNLNTTDDKGMSPLHYAVANNSYEVAKLFIDNDIDISIQDKFGNEALWTATFNARGNYKIVQTFIGTKANPRNKNKNNKSPLDFAIQINDTQLINLLNKID